MDIDTDQNSKNSIVNIKNKACIQLEFRLYFYDITYYTDILSLRVNFLFSSPDSKTIPLAPITAFAPRVVFPPNIEALHYHIL